jgi:hypothetical protein
VVDEVVDIEDHRGKAELRGWYACVWCWLDDGWISGYVGSLMGSRAGDGGLGTMLQRWAEHPLPEAASTLICPMVIEKRILRLTDCRTRKDQVSYCIGMWKNCCFH